MPEVVIYSDPHLNLRRSANFTPSSNELREDATHKGLHALLLAARGRGAFTICTGDFFDTESNPEAAILRALPIADQTDLILSGNHDAPNREGRASSLELVGEVLPGRCLIGRLNTINDTTKETPLVTIGSSRFFFVPHQLSQGTFETALEMAERDAAQAPFYRVLLLHCNYDLPDAFLTGTELNLSEARAQQLLGTFHHILIGHEHTARDLFDGRLKIVGSVFPTAFDNLDQKRALTYDTETGVFEDIPTWCPLEKVWAGAASKVDGVTFSGNEEYFDLLDDMEPGQAQRLVVRLFKGGAFGVRLRRPETPQGSRELVTAKHLERLPETIEADLRSSHPELLELWNEMKEES